MEYVNPEGLRLDGRRFNEMRQIVAQIGVVSKADGSAVFEMGNTKVIAAVYGPREIQNKSLQKKNDHALVLCEYSMAHFSTGDRRRQKNDRRSTELSLVIRQTMEACILTELMPHSQVLQADGDGNGFKTSTMRLGADVIVFSRCSGKDGKSSTQSIGLLSYTFLTSTGKEDIVVPMLDYERIDSEWCPIIRSSVGDWEKNVETVVQWSPYTSQEDLLRQFNLMRAHGTKIIIYNLWEDDENLILTLILMISNLEGSIETRKISIWLLNILTLDTIKHETVCNFRPYNCSYTGSECSVMGDISFLVDHLSDLGIREYTYLFGKHLQKDSLMEISQTSRIHLLLSLPIRKGQRMYPHITDLAYLLDTIKTIIQVGSEAF